MSARHVAVVGGGASGALAALHLLRTGAARVTLIERARAAGRGVAYSTVRPEHLLNVPARRMSALADEPDHFERWFAARGDGDSFAPRMTYGDYLAELLAGAGDGLEIVSGEAVDMVSGAVILADGRTIAADAAILAPGNFRPATPRGIDAAALGDLWVGDPWSERLAEGLGPRDVVLLLGTGLTAVDVALSLDAAGFEGRIVALSRRGLAPRAHQALEPAHAEPGDLPQGCVALLRLIRARAREIGWRSAVHALRPVTQGIWAAASLDERRRFLRHLRPWWDVHRHRIAPAVGAAIDAMQASARLAFAAGRIVSAAPSNGQARVRYRPRGADTVETLRVARIVNCTGPESDILRSGDPLLHALLASGALRADPLGIGIDVDADCRAIGADGMPSGTLSVIGPHTRGTFWESVAVPDIRVQAARVAERLTAS